MTTTLSSAITSAQITTPIPTHGGVGSYELCWNTGGAAIVGGATIGGSVLRSVGYTTSAQAIGEYLSGTWMCMGRTGGNGYITLYLRIA